MNGATLLLLAGFVFLATRKRAGAVPVTVQMIEENLPLCGQGGDFSTCGRGLNPPTEAELQWMEANMLLGPLMPYRDPNAFPTDAEIFMRNEWKTTEELREGSGSVRVLHEGEAYTQDHKPGRKNIRPDGTLIGYF